MGQAVAPDGSPSLTGPGSGGGLERCTRMWWDAALCPLPTASGRACGAGREVDSPVLVPGASGKVEELKPSAKGWKRVRSHADGLVGCFSHAGTPAKQIKWYDGGRCEGHGAGWQER